MKERSFDEMIAYFNRRVSEMDIARDYKIELLGMIAALGYKHEKTAQQWIPCSERLPEEERFYIVTYGEHVTTCHWFKGKWYRIGDAERVTAWMSLPEPYTERRENEDRRSMFCSRIH